MAYRGLFHVPFLDRLVSKLGCYMNLQKLIPRKRRPPLQLPADRGPLRVMFVITCMPVGGAETLLVNLIRRLDRSRYLPELCCLKYFGPLGETLAQEIPAFTGLLAGKYDLRVLPRLTRLLRERRIDAVVTVGTGGDKMFWGRLAAWLAGVPVIASALHSTGLPDHVEWLNRLLAPLTDAFIAVAGPHAEYLAEHEGCPARQGADDSQRRGRRAVPPPLEPDAALRRNWACRRRAGGGHRGGVAAGEEPRTISAGRSPGPGPIARRPFPDYWRRRAASGAGNADRRTAAWRCVHFLGTRSNIPELLSLVDVLVLSSHMEANPVSILEALACGKPVVATRVGSIPESVKDGENGYLTPPGDADQMAARLVELLSDRSLVQRFGRAGRERVVNCWSLERMVEGYQKLVHDIYLSKCSALPPPASAPPQLEQAAP